MKLKYEIINSGDSCAGLFPFSEIINVEIESGDPGGEKGEFANELGQFLGDWFDAHFVSCKILST